MATSKAAEVRGKGLFLGIELKEAPQKVVEKGLERGIIVNLTAQKVIRIAPALTITDEQWNRGLDLVGDLVAGL